MSVVFRVLLSFLLSISIVSCEKDSNVENSWYTVYENEQLDFFSVNFLNDTIGFVIGGLKPIHPSYNWQYIISTRDGGLTWKADSCIFPTMDDLLTEVYPISDQILLGTGYGVYVSKNFGKNWESTSDIAWGSSINDMHLYDSINWLILKGKDIFKTNNSGIAWDRVFQTDFMGVFHKFSFPSEMIGYADLGFIHREVNFEISVGLLVKTLNGGETWEVLDPEPWKSENRPMPRLNSMQFITDDIGYLVTYAENALYKTTDGGLNWNKVNSSIFSRQMTFVSENQGFYRDANSIYISVNGGITWKKESVSPSEIFDWIFFTNGNAFAITKDSKIIKR